MKKKKKKKKEESGKSCFPVFHTSCDIFIHFLHAVTFLHVLRLRRLKLKEKTEISLCIYSYNAGPPLYTQYYRTVSYTQKCRI